MVHFLLLFLCYFSLNKYCSLQIHVYVFWPCFAWLMLHLGQFNYQSQPSILEIETSSRNEELRQMFKSNCFCKLVNKAWERVSWIVHDHCHSQRRKTLKRHQPPENNALWFLPLFWIRATSLRNKIDFGLCTTKTSVALGKCCPVFWSISPCCPYLHSVQIMKHFWDTRNCSPLVPLSSKYHHS